MTEILLDANITDHFDQLFENIDCSKKTLEKKRFENCKFKHCNFEGASFLNCKFVECSFTHCILSASILSETRFISVNFSDSSLIKINWTQAKWSQVRLSSVIDFFCSDISDSSFFGLVLSGINIQDCKSHNVDFREADLSYGNLSQSDFYQSLFINTKLVAADFSEATNYNIDIMLNDAKKAIFTFPEVVTLLEHFEIRIKGFNV